MTAYSPARRRLPTAEVARENTPFFGQYNSASLLTPDLTLAEYVQPRSPARHCPGTVNRGEYTSEPTVDSMPDQYPDFDESLFSRYTHQGNLEDPHEPSPHYNSIASERPMLLTLSGPELEKLRKDDSPWSAFHLQAMPQMGPDASQASHTGKATYLAAPGMYNPSDSQRSSQYIDNATQHDQFTEPRSGYGQARDRPIQNTNQRAPSQVHSNQRASDGTRPYHINNDSVSRSDDGRSKPSSSTISMPFEPLHCSHCDKDFTGIHRKGNLARHIRHKHKDHPPIYCELCSQYFKRSDALLKHNRKKHPDLPAPSSRSQKSQQSSTQIQTGTQDDLHSIGSRNYNDFETYPDRTTNMGQPYQRFEDLRGLTYSY